MLHSLRVRLLLTLAIVIVVALGTVAFLASEATSSEFERYLEAGQPDYEILVEPIIVTNIQIFIQGQNTAFEDPEVAGDLGEGFSPSEVEEDAMSLQAFVEQFARVSSTRILVSDLNDTIVADSAEELIGINIDDLPMEPSGVVIIDDLPVLIYIEFVPGAGEQEFLDSVNRSVLAAVVTASLGALILNLALSRRILGPIGALTDAARSMEKGDLSKRVEVTTKDELGSLARAFNSMADGLENLEQLRRLMVTDVAHELRTPLSNIRGYLEALQDGVAKPTPDVITLLHEEAMLLNRLVDDLQELALAEAGQLRLEREPVELAGLTKKIIKSCQHHATQKGLSIEEDLPNDLPIVDVDPERVSQVLRNLLNNAVQFTSLGGTIRIAAKPIQDFIEVEVMDTGIGISPEDLPFVFERFYRADKSRSRATGGAGLGLAIVRQLVRAHGGEIEVESEVDHGAKFTFTLPIANTAHENGE